jgi:hypothetical protein
MSHALEKGPAGGLETEIVIHACAADCIGMVKER